MLARDIYRDFVEEPGPTIEEKFLLAGKHVGFVLAGVALILGVLDFAGIHSFSGVRDIAQPARTKTANAGGHVRSTARMVVADPSPESVHVTIPPIVSRREARQPSVVDELAAARNKDAVALAMTTSILAPPTPPQPRRQETRQETQQGTQQEIRQETMPSATPPTTAAANVQAPAPASLPITVPDAAASAQASVAPVEQLQLASLTAQDTVPPPAQTPAAASLPPPAAPAADLPAAAMSAAIPLSQVPLPRPAPPLSPADRLNLKDKEYARAERCLANAIYFEARSEPIRGQMAVAQVVLNRVFSGFYPNDICGVVYQNANRHLACQFTFACDGKRKAITERGSWAVANRIARQTLNGQIYVPEVGKSTHYHAVYVHPNWAHEMKRLVRFGVHSFYRPYAWGNGADEPVWGKGAVASRAQKTASR